jgi:hypothetical protein
MPGVGRASGGGRRGTAGWRCSRPGSETHRKRTAAASWALTRTGPLGGRWPVGRAPEWRQRLGDRGDVVRAQTERLLDVELGQPAGQVLRTDEALREGHGDTLQGVQTANLPGSSAVRIPMRGLGRTLRQGPGDCRRWNAGAEGAPIRSSAAHDGQYGSSRVVACRSEKARGDAGQLQLCPSFPAGPGLSGKSARIDVDKTI